MLLESQYNMGKMNTDSRRTSLNRDEQFAKPNHHASIASKHSSGIESAPLSPVTIARVIAAQALELQAPGLALRSFTPINAQNAGSSGVSPIQGGLPRAGTVDGPVSSNQRRML